jgi:hypothetical protein
MGGVERGRMGSFVLSDSGVDFVVNRAGEFGAVSEEEEGLDPDEKEGEDDGLEEVIDEGGFAFLEVAVAYELQDPAEGPHSQRGAHVRVREGVDEQVGPVSHGQQDGRI